MLIKLILLSLLGHMQPLCCSLEQTKLWRSNMWFWYIYKHTVCVCLACILKEAGKETEGLWHSRSWARLEPGSWLCWMLCNHLGIRSSLLYFNLYSSENLHLTLETELSHTQKEQGSSSFSRMFQPVEFADHTSHNCPNYILGEALCDWIVWKSGKGKFMFWLITFFFVYFRHFIVWGYCFDLYIQSNSILNKPKLIFLINSQLFLLHVSKVNPIKPLGVVIDFLSSNKWTQ